MGIADVSMGIAPAPRREHGHCRREHGHCLIPLRRMDLLLGGREHGHCRREHGHCLICLNVSMGIAPAPPGAWALPPRLDVSMGIAPQDRGKLPHHHHITPHHITSHHSTSHHVTPSSSSSSSSSPRHVTSHHITSQDITSHLIIRLFSYNFPQGKSFEIGLLTNSQKIQYLLSSLNFRATVGRLTFGGESKVRAARRHQTVGYKDTSMGIARTTALKACPV